MGKPHAACKRHCSPRHRRWVAAGATERITEGQFDIQVRGNLGDELGRLANAVNCLATRLAGFVMGRKRFWAMWLTSSARR